MRRTFPLHSIEDSGYKRLLYAILKPMQLFCKSCHCLISVPHINGGSTDYLCEDCFRERNRLRQHSVHPHAGSRRIIAQRAYPIAQTCQIEGCENLGIRHHKDYEKPREIIWLCRSHHALLHQGGLTGVVRYK